METTFEHRSTPSPAVLQALPEDREQWPDAAVVAYDALVRELNLWSSDNNWPSTMNSWIAEEAIRRDS